MTQSTPTPQVPPPGFVEQRRWLLPTVLWLTMVGSTLPIGPLGSSAGVHVLLILVIGVWLAASGFGFGGNGRILFGALSLLIAHFCATTLLSPCKDLLGKSAGSLVIMVLMLLALGLVSGATQVIHVNLTLRRVLGLVVVSVLLEKVWLLTTGASLLIRPSGIFSEPSHLALAMTPLLVALISAPDRGDKIWGWTSTLLLFLLSGSATLFMLVALSLLLVALAMPSRGRSMVVMMRMLIAAALALSLVMVSPFRDDFLQRLTGLGEISTGSNVSSLVYINGWQTALDNLDASGLIGLGLNRMGCEPRPVTDVTEILEFFQLEDANYNDGSFTFAKLLSELGVLGGLIWMSLLVFLFRAVIKSKRKATTDTSTLRILFLTSMLVLTIGALIRGTGYFSGPFMFGLYSFLMLRRQDVWR